MRSVYNKQWIRAGKGGKKVAVWKYKKRFIDI